MAPSHTTRTESVFEGTQGCITRGERHTWSSVAIVRAGRRADGRTPRHTSELLGKWGSAEGMVQDVNECVGKEWSWS